MTKHYRPRPAAVLNYDFRGFDGRHSPRTGTLHTTEGSNTGRIGLHSLFDDLVQRKLCVHSAVDPVGRIGYMMDGQFKGRGALQANTGRIHIEQVAFARFTAAQWHDRERQLHSTAKLVAWYSFRWGIPIRFDVEHGWCEHKDIPGNDHTDCGAHYPFEYVMDLGTVYRKHLWPGRFPD